MRRSVLAVLRHRAMFRRPGRVGLGSNQSLVGTPRLRRVAPLRRARRTRAARPASATPTKGGSDVARRVFFGLALALVLLACGLGFVRTAIRRPILLGVVA